MSEATRIPELFGSLVFNERTMEQYVPQSAMDVWRGCLKSGQPLPLSAANEIADAMKTWALEHGATHFHALVPALERRDGGKARQLYQQRRRRPRDDGLFRQGAGAWRARRVLLPQRRPCAPRLKPAATALGIPRRLPSSKMAAFASRRCSAPTAATRSTRRRRCCAPSPRSAARRCACSSYLATTRKRSRRRLARSRSISSSTASCT